MVYEKSAAGYREIAGNQRTLSLRQRQILIMVDGKRSADELIEHLNNPDLPRILADLKERGYISPSQSAPIPAYADAPALTAAASVTPVSPALPLAAAKTNEAFLADVQLVTIKHLLVSSTNDYLGIMGRNVLQKIESAQSYDQLKACISLWHMAIRESKLGKSMAGALMEKVQYMLNNPGEYDKVAA